MEIHLLISRDAGLIFVLSRFSTSREFQKKENDYDPVKLNSPKCPTYLNIGVCSSLYQTTNTSLSFGVDGVRSQGRNAFSPTRAWVLNVAPVVVPEKGNDNKQM